MLVRPYVTKVAQEAQRFPLLFVHAGHLFTPERIIEDLVQELKGRGRMVARVDVEEVEEADPRSDLVIGGFMNLVKGPRETRRGSLANARASLMTHLEAGDGRRAIMVSDVPKGVLTTEPGSQLVIDARPIQLWPLGPQELTIGLEESGLSEEDVARVKGWSGGLPRLAEFLAEAILHEERPIQEEVTEQLAEHFKIALMELDVFSIATLEDWTMGSDEPGRPLTEDDPLLEEALIGSGLFSRGPDEVGLRFTASRAEGIWREAFQEVVAGQIPEDESVGDLSLLLWRLERRLRSILRSAAIGRHGDGWRRDMLARSENPSELAQKLVNSYRQEAMVQVSDVQDVPNPCDWLTLDQTLRLLEARTDYLDLPLPPAFWRRLRQEVLPIRNRIAHSRLPKKGDVGKVRGWLGRLA